MRGLEDYLEEIENHVKNYEQKLEGFEEVVERYREGEVTYEGLTYASNDVAQEEEEIIFEIEDFDPTDYVIGSTQAGEETMDKLENIYGEQLESLEHRLEELEERRRNMLQNTEKN